MNDKINFESALASLNIKEWVFYGSEPTTEAMFNNGFKKIVIVNGTHQESSDPSTFGVSWTEIVAEKNRLQAEWDSKEYQRLRAAEYPPLADQLDMQYHDALNGTTTWQDAINAVKSKYPKSEGL
jgi:hypothetical protein